MEVMAAIVIIAVVATASLTGLSSVRIKANEKIDATNMAELNSKVEAYRLEFGRAPDTYMTYLFTGGYTPEKYNKTPFGGYYTYDATTQKVINKYAPNYVAPSQ